MAEKNRAQLVHERGLARIRYQPPEVHKKAWWVVASMRSEPRKNPYDWEWFFKEPLNGKGWGGPGWVENTHSHKLIEEMRMGEIIIAYQAYKQEIVGFAYLDSDGYQGLTDQYDTMDIEPAPTLYFPEHRRVSYRAICQLSEAKQEIEFCSPHVVRQGTVFEVSRKGFDLIISVILRVHPPLDSAIRTFLAGDYSRWDAPILNDLGNEYVDMGEYDKAVSYYQKALNFEPEEKVIKNNLELAIRERQTRKR